MPATSDTQPAALAIWARAVPAAGTLAETYLRFRGLVPPYPPALRFLTLPWGSSGPLPCLVAAVQDVAGKVIGIQRIRLANDGQGKANVAKPKLSLGTIKGGAIRLGEPSSSCCLIVCEGPEDGLSLAGMLGLPVWVAAGASFLPSLHFPPLVREVAIGADNDPAGRAGAEAAARAYARQGLTVRIIRPLDGFKDFNDELRGGPLMAAAAKDVAERLADADAIGGEGPRPLYRELPQPTPFPMDALGPVLGSAARAIGDVVQCPSECAANSVLAVASLAAQGRADVVLPIGQGKPAPLSLYLLTVLESGERKSTADGMALKPVRDFERELAQMDAGERAAHASKLSAWEANEKHLKGKHKGDRALLETCLQDLGPPPAPPLLSVIAPSGDQTMEGLFRVYQHGRPSLAMLCDDAASFLGGHSLRPEQKSTTTANLCRAWDGSKLERIRGGDGVIVLYDRRLAAHLMVQPGVAGDFLSDAQFGDQGLLARFLVSAPRPRAGTRLRDDNAYQVMTRKAAADLEPYNAAVLHLLREPPRWRNESDRTLGVELERLELTADARALYVAFANAVEAQLGPGGDYAIVRAFAAKLAEHAARIAGTLALMADAGASRIEAATLSDAIELAKYYLEEAVRLRATGWIDPALRLAEELRRWLLEQPGDLIGLRTIYQFGPSAIRQADRARTAMKALYEHEWVFPEEGGAIIDGKHHREAWRVVRC